jgi:hypothetical protein
MTIIWFITKRHWCNYVDSKLEQSIMPVFKWFGHSLQNKYCQTLQTSLTPIHSLLLSQTISFQCTFCSRQPHFIANSRICNRNGYLRFTAYILHMLPSDTARSLAHAQMRLELGFQMLLRQSALVYLYTCTFYCVPYCTFTFRDLL